MMKKVQEHQLGLQHVRNSRTKGNKSIAGVFSCVCIPCYNICKEDIRIKHNIEQEEMVCVGNTTNTMSLYKNKKKKNHKKRFRNGMSKITQTHNSYKGKLECRLIQAWSM